tara:strand:+ start:14166 stop:14699 length:534 start_codon:yes stop_codon:yes gene_type:complete
LVQKSGNREASLKEFIKRNPTKKKHLDIQFRNNAQKIKKNVPLLVSSFVITMNDFINLNKKEMKEFMMIFIGADYQELGLSPDELQNRMGKWFAWNNKMEEAGILKGGNALISTAKCVSGPDRTIVDGPFAESKELIGGYYIVDAENADAVVTIAQDYPDYDLGGTVEIREVMVFDQ